MKKAKKLLMSIMLLCGMFMLTGCFNKTALTAEQFKVEAEGVGYSVLYVTDQTVNADIAKNIYLAIDSGMKYQIEFWELDSVENAQILYNANQSKFENLKTSGSVETTVTVGNSAKYTLATGGKYKVVSRIDNTVIYVDADATYKDNIKDFLKQLGY